MENQIYYSINNRKVCRYKNNGKVFFFFQGGWGQNLHIKKIRKLHQ